MSAKKIALDLLININAGDLTLEELNSQIALAKKQMKAGGGIISFVIAGGFEWARIFLDQLDLVSLTANLGDTRTIATHPASTTHAKLPTGDRTAIGILPGLIRLSIGLEHVDDLYEDIEQALRLGHY